MNYVKELNAFREYVLRFNLTTSAVVLWYTLMQVNNSTGWKKEFQASNSIVNQMCGLSKQSVANARALLIERGLLRYIPGKKGVAPIYEMLSVVEQLPYANVDQTRDLILDQSTEVETNFSQSDAPLFDQYEARKLNKPKDILKQKQKENSRGGSGRERNAFIVYEENFGTLSPIARESMKDWIEEIGEEMVVAAMEIAVKKGGHTFSYIEKILQEWSRAKVDTVEQLCAYQKQRDLKKTSGSYRDREAARKDAIFEKLLRGSDHD